MVPEEVAVVTGSSTGIGFETSLALARNGFHTYATMHNLDKASNIKEIATKEQLPIYIVQLDVNDYTSVNNAIGKIESEKGRIDVLVNNAGYGLVGSLEDMSIEEEAKAVFETNFFGVMRTMQAVIPTMRKQNSGIIVNISTVAGRVGFPIMSAYISSKFALEGLSESMAYELRPFGIKTIIIEPGFIKTNFRAVTARKATDTNSAYLQTMQKVGNYFNSMMAQHALPPEEVAKVILHAITSKDPQLRYTVGDDAANVLQARMSMPDKEFQKLILQNFSM